MTIFYNEHSKVLVSVDCIIFGFEEGKLCVLIGRRKLDPGRGQWSLYGGFVRDTESIDDAANRVLFELTGVAENVAREALRLAGHKLPCKTKFVKKEEAVEGGVANEN